MSTSHPLHRDPQVRAGDADRETTAEVIRTQHAEGRLDAEEMHERIDACYEAKTLGELDALVADLPQPRPSRRQSLRSLGPRGLLRVALPTLLVVAVVNALVFGGAHHGHVPLFGIVFAFLAARFLLFGPWRGYRRGRTGGGWL